MAKWIWLTVFVVAAIELGGMGVDKLLDNAQVEIAAFQEQVDKQRGY